MDTFGIPHRIVAEDPEAPNAVYPGSCRLMAIYCSSVGLTGLPVDPPPPEPPTQPGPAVPTISAIAPTAGVDGSELTIDGENFGNGGNVDIGAVETVPINWTPTKITVLAVQGGQPLSAPLAVNVRTEDGQIVTAAQGFMFQDAGNIDALSAKGGKKGKKRRAVTGPAIDTHSEDVTMPSFPSGGGLMLRNAAGTQILVGPMELEAGKLYPLPIECTNGLEVVPSGLFDVTLIIARPL